MYHARWHWLLPLVLGCVHIPHADNADSLTSETTCQEDDAVSLAALVGTYYKPGTRWFGWNMLSLRADGHYRWSIYVGEAQSLVVGCDGALQLPGA